MPAPVADAVVDWLREEEMTGGYETARRHDDRTRAPGAVERGDGVDGFACEDDDAIAGR